MNIFDILILGFVLLGALQGYRKGLITGIVSLLGTLLGLVLAAREYLKVLAWIDKNTPIREWINPFVYKFMLPSVESQAKIAQQQTLERILSMFPKELRNLIGSGSVPDFQSYTQSAVQAIAKDLSGIVTDNLMKMLAFAITFSFIVLIIQIIAFLILSPVGLLSGTVNRGGGFLLGGISAFIGLAVFIGLFSPFVTLAGQATPWGLLQESQSYPYLVKTFSYLVEMLRLNLDQGLTVPLDFTKITLPDLPSLPSSIR
jgi:uncharacterized membrane protein required for colicin V production